MTIEVTLKENAKEGELNRCLNAIDLMFLGVGAIIGAGIFVLTGIAAATKAGPAIVISYIISGFACGFAALSYAELAASIGGSGSAYGYAREGFGWTVAWIIGWALILEYGISCSAVAIGWSAYVNTLLFSIDIHLPLYLTRGPFRGGTFDLPAFLVVSVVASILIIGVKTSARFNAIVVIMKLIVIGLFIALSLQHINFHFWHPFAPFGWQGVMSGAAFIFFAYIGFDAVSTAAEETINPQRNLPIGIIASLIICTLLYIIVSALLTLIAPYETLNVASPIASALLRLGYRAGTSIISVGAIAGLTTVVLVMYYGLTRVLLAMSRDGLFPSGLAKINPKTRTPIRLIVIAWVIISFCSGVIPIDDLVSIVNIGTLTAFTIVCAGVLTLRRTQPNLPRPFKTPFAPWVPLLGIFSCLYLIFNLPEGTIFRFLIWLAIGLVFYFSYSRRNLLKKLIKS